MISFLIGLGVGILVGGGLVVWFSKHNMNTLAKMREEMQSAAGKGESAIMAIVDKYSNKK